MSNDIKENIKIGKKFFDFVLANYNLAIEKEQLQSYYLQLVNNDL